MDQTLRDQITDISKLSDEELSLLIAHAQNRQLKKGEILLHEGEVCRAFYLVEKGYLRTYYNKKGVQINLSFAFEGNFTANLKSIKNKQGSEFVIEAGEATMVWVFNIDAISVHFNTHPQFTLFVRRLAVRLLLASEEYSNLFKLYTPAERYQHIEKNNPQLLQRISLSQMASYLGVARETLSRIRGKNH
ncbi:Crp/Fnr family transcriptional regulator [Mucilaginibacter sp. FT3.2]|uniref:Crp/Fnr family transcriptional regulator n=1 Tax=Mucilaginibacter sp. FT3.2 TaxID=2723090 RepID=UPI001613A3E3|nr:Crp/Fnr family transcriptional regulator [Mucilaginibacter sp. FT3.2]MBB6232377.1 CRP-like cAMP-binding protein [Mucilaginibacter sp. FT3.2]